MMADFWGGNNNNNSKISALLDLIEDDLKNFNIGFKRRMENKGK